MAFVCAAIAGAYMPRQLEKTPAVPPAPPTLLSNVALAPAVSTSLPWQVPPTPIQDNSPPAEPQVEPASRPVPRAATDQKPSNAQPPAASSRSVDRTVPPVTSVAPDRVVNDRSIETPSTTTQITADNIVLPPPDVVARPETERSTASAPPVDRPEPRGAPQRSASVSVPGAAIGRRAEPDAGSQEQLAEIEKVLQQYQLAYGRLDASGAKAIWPAVDERALSRAFEGLDSQSVKFDRCSVYISSPDADAACAGVVTYVTKVGSREPRSERRRWTFRLRKTGDSWTIIRAEARQGGG